MDMIDIGSGWHRARVANMDAVRRMQHRRRVADAIKLNPNWSLQKPFSRELRPEVRALIDQALAKREAAE